MRIERTGKGGRGERSAKEAKNIFVEHLHNIISDLNKLLTPAASALSNWRGIRKRNSVEVNLRQTKFYCIFAYDRSSFLFGFNFCAIVTSFFFNYVKDKLHVFSSIHFTCVVLLVCRRRCRRCCLNHCYYICGNTHALWAEREPQTSEASIMKCHPRSSHIFVHHFYQKFPCILFVFDSKLAHTASSLTQLETFPTFDRLS